MQMLRIRAPPGEELGALGGGRFSSVRVAERRWNCTSSDSRSGKVEREGLARGEERGATSAPTCNSTIDTCISLDEKMQIVFCPEKTETLWKTSDLFLRLLPLCCEVLSLLRRISANRIRLARKNIDTLLSASVAPLKKTGIFSSVPLLLHFASVSSLDLCLPFSLGVAPFFSLPFSRPLSFAPFPSFFFAGVEPLMLHFPSSRRLILSSPKPRSSVQSPRRTESRRFKRHLAIPRTESVV
ncbi:hypothetical protein TGARI_263460 [Toxoplasma gondii ARI]|uniref:Uncharacterized protein n=1 Tax=Toxoplasma gondii ARI TaxID=1074872 RepID=A0A139XPV0_TOXGO|nr:hypothetical protein TGARI_263460 [Toxoplasma gondii ARI]